VRLPLTEYGKRELVLFGGLAALATAASAVWAWYLAPGFALALVFVVSFFRDPARDVPEGAGLVVAPADGRVVEVAEVDEPRFLRSRAHKVAIFMSPLNVHVNRAPCQGCVEMVEHRPGRFLNAADPAASAENESAAIVIADAEQGRGRLLVRQVAGVLARRIVCAAAAGQHVRRGERIGMIKFGSRAEVYVPTDARFEVAVALGQRVRAGETVLGRFR